MKEIEGGSVDMILTDPPYGTIKSLELNGWETSWDTPINHAEMLEQCNRVLRTNGALALFGQDPYTGRLTTDTHGNLPFSYRLTWLKDNFANALIAKKAPVNYTEDICLFFKKYDTLAQHPLRAYAKYIMSFLGMSLKEINADLGHRRAEHFFYIDSTQFSLCTEATYNELIEKYNIDKLNSFISYSDMEAINRRFSRRFSRRFNLPEGKKYKSNVLEYKKDYTGLHPTQKPVALIEDLISTYTDEGDTVLDFTAGSFTTGVACVNLNRNFIGIELDEGYFDIGLNRIKERIKCLDLKIEPEIISGA
jgi:site-specific DNA-methyltransferase (adenine-specific)